MKTDDETYGQRLWARFARDLFALMGLGIIATLFVLAALAPFLAGNHAIVRVADGRLSFPVFASLDVIEWRFLIYLPLAGLLLIFRGWLAHGYRVAWIPVAIVALELGLGFLHPINDTTNDRERAASFKLMPPIVYSPIESTDDSFAPPGSKHWCGTDSTGRDIASRMVHGARTSLSIGIVSQGIALLVGVTLGGVAGYCRGWIDIGLSRFLELVECFPTLLLILVVLSLSDAQNNMFLIMMVIGLTSWTGMARLTRGEFLRLGGQPFTQAAQAVGAGDFRVIARHLLPNSLGPILVSATFGVASAILIESSLSFLGFGMQAPTPSWGDVLNESRPYIDFAWWLVFFPGLAILITVTSYNFVGEGLRDAVDPRLRLK